MVYNGLDHGVQLKSPLWVIKFSTWFIGFSAWI